MATRFSQGVGKAMGKAAMTYTAYGVTEEQYKSCAQKAAYTIPQARDSDVEELPKTEDGEDLGVGNTWWHTGRFLGLPSFRGRMKY